MASILDIVNLALSHLGDTATVSSIDPPEGSVQAEHCARFYPIARDTLLEMHAWNFSTKRVALAELVAGAPSEWGHAYAIPADFLSAVSVHPPGAAGDGVEAGLPVPVEFVMGALSDGTRVLLTDQAAAVLVYNSTVMDQSALTDPMRFSPLFTLALSWHLASMLAGPILKGDAGAKMGQQCETMAMRFLDQARSRDSVQRRVSRPRVAAPWISAR